MANPQNGLKGILQKYPGDVVILSALRTPITRAYKGGLRNAYPEQMLAAVSCVAHCVESISPDKPLNARLSRSSKPP